MTSNNQLSKFNYNDLNILKVIGHGSSGNVKLAKLNNTHQYFAIKEIINHENDDDFEMEAERLDTEIKILKNLSRQSAFIVDFFQGFQIGFTTAFTMEFLPGGDLLQFLVNHKHKHIKPEETKFLMSEVLLGLQYLHKNGVIYRDLKLEHIMLDSFGHIKLVDFGLSKILTKNKSTDEYNLANSLVGSPHYLSPEMLKGNDYNISIDFWTFGILLYRLTFDCYPFNDPDDIIKQTLYLPFTFNKKVKICYSLILKLLNKIPNQRIGCELNKTGAAFIKNDRYFEHTNWLELESKSKLSPLYKLYKQELLSLENRNRKEVGMEPDGILRQKSAFTSMAASSCSTVHDMTACSSSGASRRKKALVKNYSVDHGLINGNKSQLA